LSRWGLLDRIVEAGTPAVPRTVFHYEDEVLDLPLKPKGGVEALFAPRRWLLDRALVDAAVAAGADVRHRLRLPRLLRRGDGRVEGALLTDGEGGARGVLADLVVGADGLRSAVEKLVEAPVTRQGHHASATVYGYWSGLEVEGYHWHWKKDSLVGAIPTNG